MIQRFSLSPLISPLLSLFFIYLTRLIAFRLLLSPATLLRRSRCAHSLRLSRSPPPLKHLHDRDRGKDGRRVAYPEQLSLADFQHVDRGRSIELANKHHRFSRYVFLQICRLPYLSTNIFRNCNFGRDTQFLFFFFFTILISEVLYVCVLHFFSLVTVFANNGTVRIK